MGTREEIFARRTELCIICCFSYVRDKKKDKLEHRLNFIKFGKELECCLAQKKLKKAIFNKIKVRGDLNLDYEKLSVCPDCQRRITATMKERVKAAQLEEMVRRLQVELLEHLQELKGYMDEFGRGMKEIEEVVKGSDELCLREYIKGNVDRERGREIIQFRDRILEAVDDLRLFREEISDKTEYDKVMERMENRKKQKRWEKLMNHGTQTDPEEFPEVPSIYRHPSPTAVSASVPVVRKVKGKNKKVLRRSMETETIIKEEPVEMVVDFREEEGADEDNFFEDDYVGGGGDDVPFESDRGEDGQCYQEEGESVRRSKRPRRSIADAKVAAITVPKATVVVKPKKKKKIIKRYESVKMLDDLNNDNEIDNDGGVEVEIEQREEEVTDKQDDGSEKEDEYSDDTDSEDADAVSDAGSNFSDVDPEMKSAKRKKKEDQLRAIRSSVQNNVNENLAGMSEFRKKIVTRILLRLENDGNEQSDDPRKNYPIKYNMETGVITVGDVEVIMNDKEKSIRCSSCDYTLDPNRGGAIAAEFHMQDHICGRHLGAYKCTICSSTTVYSNIKTYRAHMFGHKKPDRCVCDICGKPFTNPESIKPHKWSHMSEDERADAVQRGMTDPREFQKITKNKPRVHQCSTCGKGFRSVPDLKVHEKIHAEDRERVICPRCGKMLLVGGAMEYHEKYGCPLIEKTNEFKCDICNKFYKSKRLLKNHKEIIHFTTEKNFICQECGKAFKTQSFLNVHLKNQHSEVRPQYPCSKSCGATFTRKNNAKRHEETCDGNGDRARRGPRQERRAVGNEPDQDSSPSAEEAETKVNVDRVSSNFASTSQFHTIDFNQMNTTINSNQLPRSVFHGLGAATPGSSGLMQGHRYQPN